MARTFTRLPDPKAVSKMAQNGHDAATAVVDAEVQTHHRLLLCLEQSRRAHEKMVDDWMRDLQAATHALATSADQGLWLQATAELGCAMWSSALSAQESTLAAWSEYQRSVLDQARAGWGTAHAGAWPSERQAQVGVPQVEAGPGDLVWLNEAMKTYERLAAAWSSSWVPDSTHAAAPWNGR